MTSGRSLPGAPNDGRIISADGPECCFRGSRIEKQARDPETRSGGDSSGVGRRRKPPFVPKEPSFSGGRYGFCSRFSKPVLKPVGHLLLLTQISWRFRGRSSADDASGE